MIPIQPSEPTMTAESQVATYRSRLMDVTGGSEYAQRGIDRHLQDIENIKLSVTKATGKPRGSISFAWAKRLALFRTK